MKANFEEKSYEQFFNAELSRRTSIYFPLGQVQEGFLGFDAAAQTRNHRLWRMLGHPFWFFPDFPGVPLKGIVDEMERFLRVSIDELPRMKTNLLFQYKRPEFLQSTTSKEWTHWNSPYFRYDIYQQQQALLMHLSTVFGSRVLVLYASPATHDVNELVHLHRQRRLIESSNFKKATDLNGHRRNTYQAAGTYSIACSKPSRIDNISLENLLQNIEVRSGSDESNSQFIINFRKQIEAIFTEGDYYSKAFNELNSDLKDYSSFPLYYSFRVMANFKTIFNLQWLISL